VLGRSATRVYCRSGTERFYDTAAAFRYIVINTAIRGPEERVGPSTSRMLSSVGGAVPACGREERVVNSDYCRTPVRAVNIFSVLSNSRDAGASCVLCCVLCAVTVARNYSSCCCCWPTVRYVCPPIAQGRDSDATQAFKPPVSRQWHRSYIIHKNDYLIALIDPCCHTLRPVFVFDFQ